MQIEASEIYSWMPQRYPMLLVDRVIHVEAGLNVHAQKAVSLNDYFYRCIPSLPQPEDFAYPHGLLVEALAQASGILLSERWPELRSDQHMVMFGSFSGISVHGCAYPGDVLDLNAHVAAASDDAAVISGTVTCNGKILLEVARISAALRQTSIFQRDIV